jgi:hypothetical protein
MRVHPYIVAHDVQPNLFNVSFASHKNNDQ